MFYSMSILVTRFKLDTMRVWLNSVGTVDLSVYAYDYSRHTENTMKEFSNSNICALSGVGQAMSWLSTVVLCVREFGEARHTRRPLDLKVSSCVWLDRSLVL